MNKAYNLIIDESFFGHTMRLSNMISEEQGKQKYNHDKRVVKELLNECIVKEEATYRLNANKLTELMFPNIDADVFLSHSHNNDFDLACKVSAYLEKKTGKKVFIDAVVWESIYELENELNMSFALKERNRDTNIYDYEKARNIASHVRLLLTTALSGMIKKCSAFVVLNTKSTFIGGAMTNSPWIYYEIFQAHQYLDVKQEKMVLLEKNAEDRSFIVDYNIEHYIKSFTEVSIDDLCAKL